MSLHWEFLARNSWMKLEIKDYLYIHIYVIDLSSTEPNWMELYIPYKEKKENLWKENLSTYMFIYIYILVNSLTWPISSPKFPVSVMSRALKSLNVNASLEISLSVPRPFSPKCYFHQNYYHASNAKTKLFELFLKSFSSSVNLSKNYLIS